MNTRPHVGRGVAVGRRLPIRFFKERFRTVWYPMDPERSKLSCRVKFPRVVDLPILGEAIWPRGTVRDRHAIHARLVATEGRVTW